MLIDTIEVIFKAGKGGAGKVSFRRNAKGPDGGNGGPGGNMFTRAVDDIFLLNQFSQKNKIEAENGEPGGSNNRSGHAAKDIVVALPVGTSITDRKSGKLIYELNKKGEQILLCRGGRGGLGNWEFRSTEETTPKFSEPGRKGEILDAVLTLRLIADFGLIGLPNAGKSSLLNELTNANAKIANYAFTTLSPNLGVIGGRVIADIPGLIEGASEGKGLGVGFLKHIEKVGILLHCISAESLDVTKDYETVRAELEKFSPELIKKHEVILLTKTDLVGPVEVTGLIQKLQKKSEKVIPVSIHDFESIEKVKKILNIYGAG